MVAAIILAAGRSTRMGRSKPLLPYGAAPGQTFVSQLVEVLKAAGLREIVVVGRPDDVRLQVEVARCAGTFIDNPTADEGQLSSLQVALSRLCGRLGRDLDAILVAPVDAPLISTSVVQRLMRAADSSPAQILRATHA